MFQNLMLLQMADAKAHIQIPIIAERAEICERLAGEEGRLLYQRILDGESTRQTRGFGGRKHCGENQKHFEKFLKPGISATGNFIVRDPGIRIGKKKNQWEKCYYRK